MKAFKFIVVSLSFIGVKALAGLDPCAPVSMKCSMEIQCSYKAISRARENISFVGPREANLRRVADGTIILRRNDIDDKIFSVKTTFNGYQQTSIFRNHDDITKSMIELTYVENRLTNANSIRGIWITENSRANPLACRFVDNW